MSSFRFNLRHPVLAILAIIAACSGAGAGVAATDPSGVTGLWLSAKEKVVIELYPCGDELCGDIVWLAKPFRKSGEFKRDKKNPDPSLRDRGWCGIQVINGLEANGKDGWENGKFYYPKMGRSFDLDIELKSDDAIEIRAYLGIPLLGKAETWTRAEPDQEVGCVPEPPLN